MEIIMELATLTLLQNKRTLTSLNALIKLMKLFRLIRLIKIIRVIRFIRVKFEVTTLRSHNMTAFPSATETV
jgi:hypothetical protein